MNSLELLQHIKNAPEFNGGDSRYKSASNSSVLYNEDIDKIERDLKALEIFKKNFLIKLVFNPREGLYNYICFIGKTDYENMNLEKRAMEKITNKEVDLLKEAFKRQ